MSGSRESKRNWRAYQKAHGRCVGCAQKLDGPSARCERCRQRDNARRTVLRDQRREAMRAAGLPVYAPGHHNGLGQRPEAIRRLDPAALAELQRLGGQAIGAKLAKEAKDALLRDVRQLLFGVRSAFTAEQVADLEPVFSEVYDRAIRRGYQRGKEQRRRGTVAA